MTWDQLLDLLADLHRTADPFIQFYGRHGFLLWTVLDLAFIGWWLARKYCPGLLWDVWAPALQLRTPLAHTEFTTDPVAAMAARSHSLYLGDPAQPFHTFHAFAVPNWSVGSGCRCTVQPPLRLSEAGLRLFEVGPDGSWGQPLSLGFTVRLDLTKAVWIGRPPDVTGQAGAGYQSWTLADPSRPLELLHTLERFVLGLFGL